MCALGVAAIAATAVGTGYSVSSKGGVFFAGGDDGVWKHYARKEATKTEKGIREYWVNCLTNEHVFTAPTTGTIEEGGTHKTEGFTETDDRWIYPATLTAQDVVMTATTKALDLGTYAGGTVSYIKAGDIDLGTDPANLDVTGFGTDHKKDGLKTVQIGTIKDGKEYALTCETTFVTAMIETADDFKEYVYPKVDADQFGYFKMANNINVNNLISDWNNNWYKNNARNNAFSGTLDGNGKTIAAKSSGICGVFGSLKNAVVKNVTITDAWYNGDMNASLIACKIFGTTFENVNTKIVDGCDGRTINGKAIADIRGTGADSPKCHAPIAGKGATGYLANTTFQSNTLKNCTFDASGWKLGSLFGWNQSMTDPTVTNCVVKAASLVQAMHSNYNGYTYQPKGVEITDPKTEKNIDGLTFVQA